MPSAWDELKELLEPGEKVKKVVFGPWGWSSEHEIQGGKLGFHEPDPPPIPLEVRGKLLGPRAAQKYMRGWSFYGGFGAPECYATYIWTSQRVIWVTQYDGATGLNWAPRDPTECIPDMPGG